MEDNIDQSSAGTDASRPRAFAAVTGIKLRIKKPSPFSANTSNADQSTPPTHPSAPPSSAGSYQRTPLLSPSEPPAATTKQKRKINQASASDNEDQGPVVKKARMGAYEQWSVMEISTLKSIVLTQIRRTRNALTEKDWALVAARLNLTFEGTTQPGGTVLASARGQSLSADKPFVATKKDRVLKGRSAKSLCAVMNRIMEKKLSEWQADFLEEAEELGWLAEDQTADGRKIVFFEGAYPAANGLMMVKYETVEGEKIEMELDGEGEKTWNGVKLLVLSDDDDETEEDEEMGLEDGSIRQQQEINDEVKRLLADPEAAEAMAAKSLVSVREEYEKVVEKEGAKKLKGKKKADEGWAAEDEETEEAGAVEGK